MRKLFLIPLILVIAIALILPSCAEETTTSTTTTAPPPTSTTTTKPPTSTTSTQPPTTTTTKPPVTAPTGTIRVANGDFANESFDPIENESVWGFAIYDTLLTFDKNGVIIPNVAESFEFTADGTWTFHIRKGIKFTNGDPLTAADVKFTIDRFGDTSISRNPWSQYISAGYNKKECVIVDDYTVKFVADHPELWQGIAFAWMRIFPKKYFETVGQDEFRKHPIGSGPWKLVELIPETQITFEANTEHWRKVPAYKYVIEYQVPEQSTRIAMLKAGDVDIAFPIDYDRLAELQNMGFRMEALGFPGITTLSFQGTWYPEAGATSDIRIRQALSYAINRQELCDTWWQGFAKPGGTFFMHRGSFGWTDDLIPEPYDLAKAKALMAEAGYPDAFADPTITLFCPATSQDLMLIILGYWEAAGFKTKLEIIDTSVYWGMLFARPKPPDRNVGWIWPWSSGSFFNNVYHSANMYTSRGIHGTSNDVKATEMYDAFLKETNPAKAEVLWADFQKYVKTLYISFGIAEIEPKMPFGPELGEVTDRQWWGIQEAYAYIEHPK